MDRIEIAIIGGGAVGLAIAYQLASSGKEVVLLEKHKSFGQETSSRNSEVIHAGIYYPKNSLKAKLCVEGKYLLYDFMKKHSIPFAKCGKYIVAITSAELDDLYRLKEVANTNGVNDIKKISRQELEKVFSGIQAKEAIFSPSTGIFDTHSFMACLEKLIQNLNGLISYDSEVLDIERLENGYRLIICDTTGEKIQLETDIVINSAGLNAERISKMVGIDTIENNYIIYYCKGEYFNLPPKYKNLAKSLLYPVVPKDSKSLGIHTVIDLQGRLKLGPNAHYVDEINYDVDQEHKNEFFKSVKRYFPFVKKDELTPDMAGVRPKLQKPGGSFKDFIIKEETENGFPSFINLLGIDSPGLTSSLAIGKYVKNLLY